MAYPPLDREAKLKQLARVLESDAFRASERSRVLLRYLIEQTIDGSTERLKEYTLATEALGRSESFDPRTDPIVRAEVSRLRQRLELYYATEGRTDSLGITLPKGTYLPVFETRAAEPAAQALPVKSYTGMWKVVAAVLGLALTLSFWMLWQRPRPRPSSPMHLDVDLAAGQFIGTEVGTDVSISPDGTLLVWVALDSEGKSHLFRRRLQNREFTEIPGTEGARNPFFSASGTWVGFGADGKLKKTLVEGGSSPITLCEATDLLGATWGKDDAIVAVLDSTSRLFRIPSNGGTPTVLADLKAESHTPLWPQLLPGGKALLFTSGSPPSDNFNIGALSLADGKAKILIRGGTYGRYLASGHLVYVNRGTLFAVPFDPDRLELNGPPFAVVEDVSYSSLFGYAQFDVSQEGTLVYRRSVDKGSSVLKWLEPAAANATRAKPGLYQYPRVSPDGRQISFSLVDGERSDLWISDRQGREARRWTSGDRNYIAPLWTPDGQFLLSSSSSSGIYWQSARVREIPRALMETGRIDIPWSFRPDGRRLAYFEMDPQTGFDLWTVPVDGGGQLRAGKPEVFLATKAMEVYPAFSPDGRWLAYGSNESGTWQVYVRAFPDNGSVVQVSKNGGRIPAWSRNGHDLLFRTDDQRIMVASYRVDSHSFVTEPPRRWSPNQLADTGVLPNFDLAPDGNVLGLLPSEAPEQPSPSRVTFIFNFFEELRRTRGPR